MIKRVWQVDPLRCPLGSTVKIVSFIEPTRPDVIRKILAHCGLADEPPRTPPNAPPPGFRPDGPPPTTQNRTPKNKAPISKHLLITAPWGPINDSAT